jgi:YD repeat-containing protein
VKDASGMTAQFQYGQQSQLASIQIGTQPGHDWQLGYDSLGRLSSFRDPLGRTAFLHFDGQGRVNGCSRADGASQSFQMDDQDRLRSLTDQTGRRWTFEHDDAGHVRRVTGPKNERWDYDYWQNLLLGINGPTGSIRVKPRKKTLTIQSTAANGQGRTLVYDRSWRLTEVGASGAKPIRLRYGASGNNVEIHSVAGRILYDVDESALTMTLTFQED